MGRNVQHNLRQCTDLESVNWLKLAMNSHDSASIRFIVRRNCFRWLTTVPHEISVLVRKAIG